MMSYAIQARPSRPWRELLLIATLILWALYQFVHAHYATSIPG